MEPKWLEWAKQLQSIAQTGLAYSGDEFDIERFKQIREISTKMVSANTDMEQGNVREVFAGETGYGDTESGCSGSCFPGAKSAVGERETGWCLVASRWLGRYRYDRKRRSSQ